MPSDPLVFLPGFMCDARLFWHPLQELSSERSVMVARLRGATIEEMAQAVLDEAPPQFALVGHWLGAVVAIEILRRAPDQVTQVALLDVSPLPEMPQIAAARETRIVKALTGRLDEMMLEEIPADSLAPDPGRAEIQAMLLEMAAGLGANTFEAQSRALMRRPDLQRTLRATKTRALLMCGEYDKICPPRRHEFLAELMPHAEFRLILGAGHLSPLEQPEKITQNLRDWLEAPLLLA